MTGINLWISPLKFVILNISETDSLTLLIPDSPFFEVIGLRHMDRDPIYNPSSRTTLFSSCPKIGYNVRRQLV